LVMPSIRQNWAAESLSAIAVGSGLERTGDDAARTDRPGGVLAPCSDYWFASDLAMIAWPVMFTPQGGNSLAVKKLSVRSGKKFSPALKFGFST